MDIGEIIALEDMPTRGSIHVCVCAWFLLCVSSIPNIPYEGESLYAKSFIHLSECNLYEPSLAIQFPDVTSLPLIFVIPREPTRNTTSGKMRFLQLRWTASGLEITFHLIQRILRFAARRRSKSSKGMPLVDVTGNFINPRPKRSHLPSK